MSKIGEPLRTLIKKLDPSCVVSDVQLTPLYKKYEKGKPVGEPYDYALYVITSKPGKKYQIPTTWVYKDEDNTPAKLEQLIRQLAENTVNSMSDLIEFEETGELKPL